jgi:DNA polymerase-3 subunit gamma/tau
LQAPAAARTTAPVGAPPGQVLPVRSPVPSRTGLPSTRPEAQPAGEVVGVPVRLQAESRRDLHAERPVAGLVLTEEGDFWQQTVRQLIDSEAVTALVRELALQSQLVGRDTGHWMLRVERESLNQPASRERLQSALQSAGHGVQISVEVGPVGDSPARRQAAAAAARQQVAEEIIRSDPFVIEMVRDFGARIVPGSIKPVFPHPQQPATGHLRPSSTD